jgi:hypothetical protein
VRFVVDAVESTERCVVVAFVVVVYAKLTPCVKVEEEPEKIMLEVVALTPACGCVNASEPAPVPQAAAVAESVPSAPTWRQRVPTPPAEETMRFVVDAVERIERFVVVAFVVVEFRIARRSMDDEALEMRPFVKIIKEVVADCPAAGWVKAS